MELLRTIEWPGVVEHVLLARPDELEPGDQVYARGNPYDGQVVEKVESHTVFMSRRGCVSYAALAPSGVIQVSRRVKGDL